MHPILAALIPLIEDLNKTLGPNSEVVLHDLSQPQSSVIALSGNITDRQVGSPATDLLLQLLQQGRTNENLVNYSNTTPDGKVLRSSTLFLKDEDGEVIGCLCINYDLTYFLPFNAWLGKYCTTQKASTIIEKPVETFAKNVEDIVEQAIDDVVTRLGVPVALMTKQDRIKAIKMLDEKGIFLIKNSVPFTAMAFRISRATLYSYLNQANSLSSTEIDQEST